MEFRIVKSQNAKMPQDWSQRALGEFRSNIQNPDFPCIFALRAYKIQGILFLPVSAQQIEKFVDGMIEYTEFVKITPVYERVHNPLVVFFRDQFVNLAEEQTFAWQQLQLLHNGDPKK